MKFQLKIKILFVKYNAFKNTCRPAKLQDFNIIKMMKKLRTCKTIT